MYRILIVSFLLGASVYAQDLRLTAGESRLAVLAEPIESIVSVTTEPVLAFPLVVRVEAGGLRVSTPPATRPGSYRIEVSGRTREGRTIAAGLRFIVDAVQVPRAASGRAPVILMNGFQLSCSGATDSTLAASQDTFGEMAALLQSDGASVTFFNNCAYGSDVPIEELAAELGAYISALRYTDGTPVTQVDLVAHSMGGLIARAYLSGLQQTGVFTPLLDPKVHKLVQLATPNFGSFLTALLSGTQTTEMTPGSEFLWSLATWNQWGDDLRGVDALAVVGNQGTHYAPGQRDDGVVSVTSGSLGFARPDARTRVVPYCHVPVAALSLISLIVNCSGSGIAFIDDASHLSARIVRSFLADTQDWTTLGKPPSQDPVLSQFGGMILSELAGGGQATFGGVPLIYNNGAFYAEFLSGAGTILGSGRLGTVVCGPFTEPPGYYSVVRCNPGSPMVTSVGPQVTGAAAKTVLSGASVTLTGSGFGQLCSTCYVMAEVGSLQVSAWSDTSITVFLPPTVGLIHLFVHTAMGSDVIGVFTNAPPLTSVMSSVTNAASSAPGAIAPGEMITIKGTGLGPATGVSFALNSSGGVDKTLAGTSVLIGGFAAPITYASATQVNAIVPVELASALTAAAVVQVSYLGNASALTTLAVLDAQPAVFTFNSTGIGQAVAANQDSSFNGPSHPAPQGSYLTIYWTGGGVTTPGGITGSVNGSTLKTLVHSVSVTVGGQPATVTFQGAAPGLIDGVQQLNIRLDPATPSGPAQTLIVTSNGVSSPPTATITVQ